MEKRIPEISYPLREKTFSAKRGKPDMCIAQFNGSLH